MIHLVLTSQILSVFDNDTQHRNCKWSEEDGLDVVMFIQVKKAFFPSQEILTFQYIWKCERLKVFSNPNYS